MEKDKLFYEYLEHIKTITRTKWVKNKEVKIKGYEQLPSYEDFVVFLIEEKKFSFEKAEKISGGLRGKIYIYAMRFLKNKASDGGRNSGIYLQMLKELATTNGALQQDKIIINFNLDSKDLKNRLEKEKDNGK